MARAKSFVHRLGFTPLTREEAAELEAELERVPFDDDDSCEDELTEAIAAK